jgi:Mor family transcriptional regulator
MPGLPEKSTRNAEIYKKKQAGMSWRELMVKYELSLTRLQVIVRNEATKHKQTAA